MSLFGVDLGTSGVRVVALSAAGTEIAGAARATALSRPGPGLVETDAEEVLAAAAGLLAEVATHPAVGADPPEAISFSVQGEAVLPVGRNGHALAPAPVSMDRRGTEVADRVAAELGADRIQHITGQPAHPMFSLYKIASGGPGWTGSAVHGYRCLGDYVAGRLGARAAMDTSMAARTGAYDVEAGVWSAELTGAAGVDPDLLPEVVPAGTVVGTLTAEAAQLTGLPAGLPLIVGSHDQAAAFLGGGGRRGAISVVSFGSSDCLTVGTAGRPRELTGTGLASYPMGDGSWLTLAGTAAGGWALDWFATLVGVADPAERDALFEAASAEPPQVLVLPYFAGSGTLDNDPLARGAVVGLTLGTSRADLARAFLESFGFEIRKIVDALAERDVAVGVVHAVGGGARSLRSLAIRADASGLPLTSVPGHAAARGAALLAGVGIGRYPSIADLPAPECRPAIPPDPVTATWYTAQSRRFRDLYPTLLPHDRSYPHLKEQP
ncbi:FGGY-family carbohydrate kinase [Acrocarpospora catenulata]|uniref:FGGY-family carbohydrate kinase n=1 Tax=Acrocarpospora catenulata TaxID=2836182 RepID=UPI001BDAA79A|nr:FGGY-family carbohydrate kinase [Acrocarpospora catenulata]